MDTLKALARRTHARANDQLPETDPGELSGVFMGFMKSPGNIENLDGFEMEPTDVMGPRSWRDNEYPRYRRLCVALGREAILTLKAWHVLG